MEAKENDIIKICVNLLESNHNLILTGAPGTGKTYLAKEIAKKMGCNDDEIGFVQFHPSYDYTDFVEGLRPIQDENGTVGFERKDGVFKEFCKIALNSSVKHTFYSLTKKLENGYILKLLGGADANIIYKDGLIKADEKDPKEYPYTIECSKIETLMNKCKGESINGLNKIKENIHLSNDKEASYYWAVYDYIRNNINPFVFIIDEINRGEISKIFGELFFSIDPGYRGKKGKVRTQYANMQSVPNEFDEALGITDTNNYGHFYIPENVYIIGTMNDIDRSVESMDFAFRRRFAFKEVTAKDSQSMFDNEEVWKDKDGNLVKPDIDDLKNRMDKLNNAISQIDGLSSAYHIGGSYFLKLNNYDGNSDEKFKKLWNYHIEGLLREYLRWKPRD